MDLDTVGLRGASFAISSFVASSHPLESCGLNGLPLTPHSTAIQGGAQLLLTCKHQHLARYLDVQRGKHQRIIVVQESWPRSLSNLEKELVQGEEELMCIAKQILQALAYLNQMNVVNLNLVRENVMLDSEGHVKLFNYGLGRMTNYGSWVAFPCLTDPRVAAPEVVAQGLRQAASVLPNPIVPESPSGDPQTLIPPDSPPPYSTSSDSWSLGLLLASLALDIPVFWPGVRVGQVIRKVVSLQHCDSGSAVVERLSREHGCVGRVATIPQAVLDLITACLTPNPEARPTPHQLLVSDLVGGQVDPYSPPIFPSPSLRCANLPCPLEKPPPLKPLERLTVSEIYYLWQLAGGDVQAELARQGLLIASPPCLSLPSLCTTEGQMFGQPKPRHTLYNRTLITLSVTQLEKSLSSLKIEELAPLIDSLERAESTTRSLPLVIREKDVKYQCVRTILYRRLLQAFPHRRKNIWSEALVDVVPMYRSYIWASLLNIPSNLNAAYAALDKESWNPVDRQIEVDIPRCHQYSELLASPEGHRKLKRVLKAWVADNPSLVYWQGLDSLAAPFIFLNFNDEALAWACLSAFIPKYLHNMFMKDNAVVIQEYLAKFSHLQAFHDPELFNHLDEIGFIPDLYAIPWVLTMFSHVFPLHKIFHLWDRLLLGNSSFPLCVGLAVLLQLRAQLMEAQFNECILLFSDMPAVDIDNVVSTSMEVFTMTPASLTWREHDSGERKTGPLHISPLPVKTLKEEKVGRISGSDLISLLDTGKLLAVDTRPVEEWKMGSLNHSISIPASSAFTPTGDLAFGEKEVEEAKRKGLVVAVVGSAKDKAQELLVAEGLRMSFAPARLDVDPSIIDSNLKMVENPLEESLFPASLLPQSKSRNKVEELDSLLPAPDYPSLTVIPKPGLCVKTKNDKGLKFFVNICKLSEVPAPPPMEEGELERMIAEEDYSNLWRVPMSLGEPRKEKDKSGGECWAAEVAINTKWFEVMAASQVFLGFVITVAMEGLGDKYGENARLDRDSWVVLKNKKAMGDVLPAHRIQQRATAGIQAMDCGESKEQIPFQSDPQMRATSTTKSKNKTPDKSTKEKSKVGGGGEEVEPKYFVKGLPSLDSLERLRVEVDLPGVKSGKEVVVDVGEDRLVVCSPKLSYLLDIFLPYKLKSEVATSAFARDEQKLVIFIPVLT